MWPGSTRYPAGYRLCVAMSVQRVAQHREELVSAVSERIADNQARAERRANPLWGRTEVKELETMATVGVSALIRRAMNEAATTNEPKGVNPHGERGTVGKRDVARPNGETKSPA